MPTIKETSAVKILPIVWQRLVDTGGKTCERCGTTYEGLQQAVAKLEQVLRPLGIETTFETREIDRDSFTADPSQSNRVWIAGGDSECRTIEMGKDVFEAVPSELIVKAALVAASELVEPRI
jgi:hypothetical protein